MIHVVCIRNKHANTSNSPSYRTEKVCVSVFYFFFCVCFVIIICDLWMGVLVLVLVLVCCLSKDTLGAREGFLEKLGNVLDFFSNPVKEKGPIGQDTGRKDKKDCRRPSRSFSISVAPCDCIVPLQWNIFHQGMLQPSQTQIP